MTTPSDCPGTEQAVGWALHALEPDEEIAVALHIPDCAVCQAAVIDTQEVIAGLGVAVEQVEPPPSLRSDILRAAAETPQEAPTAAQPRRVERGEPVAQPGRRPATWLSRRRLIVAAVALVAAVAVGGFAIRTVQLEQTRTQQAQALSELVGTLVPAGSRHAVLATPDGLTVGAVVLESGQRQVLTVGMPPNAADRNTYVLWGQQAGGAVVALGTFDVNAPDPAMRPVGSDGAADQFTAYAVSLEPGRVAPASPSSVMAEGKLV